jgi:hypothetical protein
MVVSIISSPAMGASQFADSLQGGGVGFQFGTSEASLPAPTRNIFLRHDGVSKITNLAVYLKSYSQTYGGEYSASADLVKAIDQGNLGSGFQIDFDWDGIDFTTYTVLNSSIGISQETAIEIPVTAILFNNGGTPATASGPVQGELGAVGNSTLGDTVKLKCRWVVPTGEPSPGRRQIDLAYIYNFTT